jgi:hypothetical protein
MTYISHISYQYLVMRANGCSLVGKGGTSGIIIASSPRVEQTTIAISLY